MKYIDLFKDVERLEAEVGVDAILGVLRNPNTYKQMKEYKLRLGQTIVVDTECKGVYSHLFNCGDDSMVERCVMDKLNVMWL